MDADLVLIHGFWSSPATWERLIARLQEDTDLAGLRIHAFGYESPKLRWLGSPTRIPDYNDIAQSLPAYLAAHVGAGAGVAVATHSQGGLILQRFLAWMLAEGRGRELAKIRLIVMLSCPNEGSEYLRSIRAAAGFGHHPQAGQLDVLTREVAEARRVVLRQVINATTVDDRHCPIPMYVYSGRTDNVVLRESAQSIFPDAGVLPGNHFSILDPDAPGHLTYAELKRRLLETFTTANTDTGMAASPRAGGRREGVHGAQERAEVSATVLTDSVVSARGYGQRDGSLFIDREEQRARLGETLRDDVSPIILVTGPGGVGKTQLVDEVLAGLRSDTAEMTDRRVCRHDAAPGGSQLDMKALIHDIEHGDAPANLHLYGPASLARMQVALDGYTGPPVVIIVDSAECLLDDLQSLRNPDLDEALEMLSARSRSPVKVILVSQKLPRADGAITWPTTAHSIPLSGLAVADFRRFFENLDPAAECGLATLGPVPFAQVHSRLHGNPRLAELLHALISWADRDLGAHDVPGWLAAGTEEEVPQRLTDKLIRGLPAGHQRVIEALAALGTPVGEPTVCALLEPSLSRERVRETLRTLALRRIVRMTGDQRYHLPRSDVDRVLEHLPAGDPYEEPEGGPTRRNLLHKAARVLDSLQKDDDDVHAVGDLYPHFARLDVLVRAAMYAEAHEVIMALDPLLRQWNQGPLLREQREAVRRGTLDDPYAAMENHAALGDVYSSLGLFAQASSSYQAALSLARSHHSLEDLGRIYINMGQMYKEHNKFGKAREYFDNGLMIAQEEGREADADRMAALEGLADCARALGRFTEAIRLGEAALAIAEPDESPRTVDIALKLARWFADVDRMKDAAGMLALAEVSVAYEDRSARAAYLDAAADLSFRRGGAVTGTGADVYLDDAARTAQQAVDLALAQRDPDILRQARTTLCVVHLRRDDVAAARREIEAVVRHRLRGHSLLVVALRGLVAWRGGESRRAAEIFGQLQHEAQMRVDADEQDFAARDMLGVALCAEALADGTSLAPAVRAFRTAREAIEPAPGLTRQLRFLVEQLVRGDLRPGRLRPVLEAITEG